MSKKNIVDKIVDKVVEIIKSTDKEIDEVVVRGDSELGRKDSK